MAVTLIDCRIGGEAIEITVAFRIPHPNALAARQNDPDRLVVIGAKARFPRDEIIACWIHLSSPRRFFNEYITFRTFLLLPLPNATDEA
jgi:hypothetical protein